MRPHPRRPGHDGWHSLPRCPGTFLRAGEERRSSPYVGSEACLGGAPHLQSHSIAARQREREEKEKERRRERWPTTQERRGQVDLANVGASILTCVGRSRAASLGIWMEAIGRTSEGEVRFSGVAGGGLAQREASGRAAVVVSSDGAVARCSTSQGAPLRGGFFPVLRVPLGPPRTQTHGIRLVIAHHRLGVRGRTRLQGGRAGDAPQPLLEAIGGSSRPVYCQNHQMPVEHGRASVSAGQQCRYRMQQPMLLGQICRIQMCLLVRVGQEERSNRILIPSHVRSRRADRTNHHTQPPHGIRSSETKFSVVAPVGRSAGNEFLLSRPAPLGLRRVRMLGARRGEAHL